MKRRAITRRLFVLVLCVLTFAIAIAPNIVHAAAGMVSEFGIPTANSLLTGITSGPDGNLWFTEENGNKIGRITPKGIVTEFPVLTASSEPFYITRGPDGNLWFTEIMNRIGRITPKGIVTEFPIPTANSEPWGITSGPDGNLWFAEDQGNKIGRITTH